MQDHATRAFMRPRRFPFAVTALFGIMLGVAAFLLMAGQGEAKTEPISTQSFLGVSYPAIVSAYTASEDETDSRPHEMASGRTVYEGALACPSRLKFGTLVLIEDKTFVCEDRMNRRYRNSNHFDILVSSKKEAFAFGRKSLIIIVIQ